MKQFFYIMKQYADCSERTMETREHFKNVASPKSLMSREILVLFIFICCVGSAWGQTASDYRADAERGDKTAQYNLGVCYNKGYGVTKDYTQAVNWYRKAAEQGYAKAQNSLGNCYENGYGVIKDYAQAVNWFRKAAEQELVEAQYNLGICYYNGYGVKDYAQAVYWFRKAAEQGFAMAQHNLGVCYYKGDGVTQDYTQAVNWYRKAAEQGYAQAQHYLGYSYKNGEGVETDGNIALYWYEQALKGCYEEDKKDIERTIAVLKGLGYSASRANITSSTPNTTTTRAATYLTTNPSELKFSRSGGTKTVTVSTDGTWEVDTSPYYTISNKTSNSFQVIVQPAEYKLQSFWLHVKSGEKTAYILIEQGEKPVESSLSGSIENIWVEHNVSCGWNRFGMKIHVKFHVNGMLNKQGRCNVYFFFQNGNKLIDYNGQYKASDGQVSVGDSFKAVYENSVWNDFSLLLPYDELHLARGFYNLKLLVNIFDNNGKEIATSEYVNFTYSYK